MIDASHLGASLIGVVCLLLAQGLRRRLSAAWAVTLVLLLLGCLLSLLKGFDWEEASILAMTAALLAIFRKSFYRRSRLMEQPFSPLYVTASICVVAASVWLLLFAYRMSLRNASVVAIRAGCRCPARPACRPGQLRPAADHRPGLAVLRRATPIEAPTGASSSAPSASCASPAAGWRPGDDRRQGLLFHESDDAFLMYGRGGRS